MIDHLDCFEVFNHLTDTIVRLVFRKNKGSFLSSDYRHLVHKSISIFHHNEKIILLDNSFQVIEIHTLSILVLNIDDSYIIIQTI